MRIKRFLFTLVGFGSAIALAVAPSNALADSKTRVKAAMIYNIMAFINFPGNSSDLKLCGLVGDSIGPDLRALNGRSVGKASISVSLLASTASIGSNCDVIYLEDASPKSVLPLSRGQVLIGSGRNFAENGGTVGLINFGGQIRFTINDGAAKRTGITFSSQLLQLAARVIS